MDKGLFSLGIMPSLFVLFFGMPSLHLFLIFNDFSFLVTYKHALMVHQTIFLVRR